MAPTAMDKAIADRDAAKDVLTFVEAATTAHATTPLGVHEVNHLMSQIKQAQTDLSEVHKKIIHLQCPDPEPHRVVYQTLSLKALQLSGILSQIKATFPSTSTPVSTGTGSDVKLPRLELPTFDGSLSQWFSFRDMYTSAVHSKTNLSNAEKFSYLKGQLKGEAARLVTSMGISDANYDIAWKRLCDRYQNDRELFIAIMDKLTNQPMIQPESAKSALSLIDISKECIEALEALHVPSIHCDPLFYYLIQSKMDSRSKQLWKQGLKDRTIPKLDALYAFLEQYASSLSEVANRKREDKPSKHKASAYHVSSNQTCCSDAQPHPLHRCQTLLNAPVHTRMEIVKKQSACFNCLKKGHSSSQCPSTSRCRTCNEKHHTLLHKNKPQSQHQPDSATAMHTAASTSAKLSSPTFDTIFATAVVDVLDKYGNPQPCRVFLDNGSNSHYITDSCLKRLGIQPTKYNVQSTGLGGELVSKSSHCAMVSVCSRFDKSCSYDVKPLVVNKIAHEMPAYRFNENQWTHLQFLPLADPQWYKPQKIDILLGADIFFAILKDGKKTGEKNSPVAINSEFGWLVGGGTNLSPSSRPVVYQTKSHQMKDESLDHLLRRMWEVDQHPADKILTKEEKECEDHFQSTYSRMEDGRFMVRLPLKSNASALGPSLQTAIKRLYSLERRLKSLPQQREDYIKFMQEYKTLGHMVQVNPDEVSNFISYYIPHHFVLKDSSTTTKLRVVFDASAKTVSGPSLNDIMMVGPTVQDSLVDKLVRFRLHNVVFTADICKMYRQIMVDPADTHLQRIVWRDDPSEPIKHYNLLTVTYGTAAAPYLATRCLHEIAELEKNSLPIASAIAQRDFYIDDVMTGEPSVPLAREAQSQLLQLHDKAKFPLRKFSSNSEELLNSLEPDQRETQTLLSIEVDPTIKALGICWNPKQDEFSFKISFRYDQGTLTKRQVLSEIARFFDPVGWLSPVLIGAKVLMQNIWKCEVGWDDPVPEPVQQQWNQFRTDAINLESLILPRCYFSDSLIVFPSLNRPWSTTTRFCLVGFCDASEVAYAAVIYMCAYDKDQTACSLITSKTRVAPLKKMSLPRLELCAASLLSDLMTSTTKALKFVPHKICAFTDSTVTLAWIQSDSSRWKTFVANRVTKIQEQIPASNWGHVRSEDNPADCASRGINSETLINHNLWWSGPSWLQSGVPTTSVPSAEAGRCEEEERKVKPSSFHTFSEGFDDLPSRFSSLLKLQRVTAYVLRFTNNLKCKVLYRKSKEQQGPSWEMSGIGSLASRECGLGIGLQELLSLVPPLTPQELNDGLLSWTRSTQRQAFPREISCLLEKSPLPKKSRVRSLQPFLDADGVLRVGGRLKHSSLSPDQKNPILLPRRSRLTDLVIVSTHNALLHAGPQLTRSCIQRRFWILRAKDAISFHIRRCVTCTRHRAQSMQQVMADLPSFRVNPSRAFLKCGVDYAGPFSLRIGKPRSRDTMKAYIAVFVCCSTHAIHLEVVSDLTTEAFLAALKRFVSRRGLPSDIFSDCGTNFVGANRELKKLLSQVLTQSHNQEVANQLSKDGISWHFNPPSAPHFGGLWESGVKSMKTHLYRIMGKEVWTFEQLSTAIAQIEAVLNSRPITPLSSDPTDFNALTPGHFLIGSPLTMIPEPDLTDVKFSRLSKWQQIQQMTQHFWRRWSSEYLTRLQHRPKWMDGEHPRQLEVGDMVLVKDENSPPAKWNLARVLAVHPGADSKVRVATIKTATSELKRPIVKLCLLPIDKSQS